MKRPSKIIQLADSCVDADRIDENVLWNVYCGDNYSIEYTPKNEKGKRVVVVYFSSNGLYYGGKTSFDKRIVQQDRYEWKRNKLANADMHIFVRDIWQHSYFYGINDKIDNIMALADFIREKIKGFDKVIMIGLSAGGYAASLLGNLLNANYVLSFSGQFDVCKFEEMCAILRGAEYNPEVMINEKEAKLRQDWLRIDKYLNKAKVPVYYFVGANNEADKPDCLLAGSIPSVRVFRFNNEKHGMPVDKKCLTDLINMDENQLEDLYAKFKNKKIGWNEFGFSVSRYKYIVPMIYNFTKSIERSIRHFRKKK